MIRRTAATLLLGAAATGAQAFDYNDCIINGMKGVQSDQAARLVRDACRQKQQDQLAAKRQKFVDKFGALTSSGEAAVSDQFYVASAHQHDVTLTNQSKDKTLTLIRLMVSPSDSTGQWCEPSKAVEHWYELALLPGKTIRLRYPPPATTNYCFNGDNVHARPSTWTDNKSFFSGTAQPLGRDPRFD